MSKSKKKNRGKKAALIILGIVVVLAAAIMIVVPKVDTLGYTKIADNAVKSIFHKTDIQQMNDFLEKTDGFIKGVCHPNENYDQIKECNIEWMRFDLTSMPYDDEGNPTPGYLGFKERAKSYADRGFKVMCITPYPDKYIEAGYDPRTDSGKEKVKEIAKFIAKDLQGIVAAFQITNEMGIEHFTLPLTLEEAAEFTGIQLEAMMDVKGGIITGFNLAGTTMYGFSTLMKPWLEYCDYVGIDVYLGCFENVFKELFIYDALIKATYEYTKKPILLNEFGYMGYGDVKTREQKNEILKTYGYENEEEARKDIMGLVNKLPEDFKEHMLGLEYASEEELAHKLFDTELANHLYREIQGGYQLSKYRHTPEDQGRFFTDVLARFKKIDCLCGSFVYCYSDSDACYICGQTDCPVETGWGLVDGKGEPKPAYYAVQKAFGDF